MKAVVDFAKRAGAARMVAGLATVALFAASAGSVLAALPVGAQAPDFKLQAALAGDTSTFDLQQALKKGPVVLYFFPAAFTSGCTQEAHEFAEASDSFDKLHATIIGVTAGNVDRVAEFSKVECRNKFRVAADPGAKIAAQYDSQMQGNSLLSDRTSYVIAPDGKILLSYTDSNPHAHIEKTLAATQAWAASH